MLSTEGAQLRQRIIHLRRVATRSTLTRRVDRDEDNRTAKFSIVQPASVPPFLSRNLCKAYSHRCLVTEHY